MRSSVSVILSSSIPDTNMSHPDYEQTCYDHAAILVLVKHLGEDLSGKSFSRFYDRISRVSSVKVVDSNGVSRCVYARFIRDYPVGNNDWGDFQTHRRLLGLITIGKCKTQVELNEVCRLHETLKVKYSSTLYDSRSIIVGVNDGPSTPTFPTPSNFNSRALFFATETDVNNTLETQLADFLSSLFWVLESKRHERSRDKIERVALLVAPFERRESIGLDMESRNNRRRCLGRMTKHLGDLSLQAGLPSEAVGHFQAAADILRPINDWLWLGGALEGLCAASVILQYPKPCRSNTVQRNSSLQEGKPKPSTSVSTTSSLPFDLPDPEPLPSTTRFLTGDEICKSYRETIIHYSKYQNAGVIETESCYKAARIAIEQNAVLQAASFLQNVVFINLVLTEEEKIHRLLSLSELYTKIGFHRKSSFYHRLAATRYVSARNPQTDWEQCYNLMLQALAGHKLTLDPADYPPGRLSGWPGLQKQVVQDLVVAAKRVGHSALATRHMTFLLQVLWHQLSATERHECALQLQLLASQCEGSPVPLVLDSGLVIPPANLVNIPDTRSFAVQNLKPHLRPSKLEITKEDYGPFLFTPLKFGSLERKSDTISNKLSWLWVAEESCEVSMELTNPLPFDLEVSNMRLLTKEVVFESLPLTLTLPAEAVNFPVTLSGTPKEVGELEITGYSTHTLGVKSNCRLKFVPKMTHTSFAVEVVPALPQLQVSILIPSPSGDSNSSVSLFAGESCECCIVMHNVGALPITMLDVTIDAGLEPSFQAQLLQWSQHGLQLPLLPGDSTKFPLQLFAASNFLATHTSASFPQDGGSLKSSWYSGPNSFASLSSVHPSLQDRGALSSPSYNRSGPSSLNSFCSQFNKLSVENVSKVIECHIKVRYSGGPGLNAGYGRTAACLLNLHILNSILVTNWDVMPADTCSQFYLVLDVANMTNQELELKYTNKKSILIEDSESCRIPIPVDRCPLSKIGKFYESVDCMPDEMSDLNRACSEHIASLVDLQWMMVGSERTGRASLQGMALSPSMLDIVRTSPIHWEVSLNGSVVSGQEAQSSETGACLQLGVWVHNSLSWPLLDMQLAIDFFQDHQNGIHNSQLDTRLATTGSTKLNLPKILEHGSAYHECTVVFFTPGQYKVNIQCSSHEKHTWRLIPPLEIEVAKFR